jgi:hypothetical protein
MPMTLFVDNLSNRLDAVRTETVFAPFRRFVSRRFTDWGVFGFRFVMFAMEAEADETAHSL